MSLAPSILDIKKLRYERDILRAEKSLHEFLKQSWSIIQVGIPFIDNWHLHVIAEHLEGCYRRDIKNLLINVPPRSGKTNLISIAYPAWVWIQNSSEKFLYASYAYSLAEEHGGLTLALMQSNWYQERWGHLFKLRKTAKQFIINDNTGYRIATSIGGVGTGLGGSLTIADDPNSVKDNESKATRDSTNRWWNLVWPSRRNDPANDVRILVQQRTEMDDITGTTLKGDEEDKWHKVIIPMEYEHNRRFYSVIKNKIYEDPRTEEGELLCSERWSQEVVNDFKSQLGEYGYAGQYQQRPTPQSGGIIKKSWFKWWKHSHLPKIDFTLQSHDTALTDKDTSSYYACTTWGVFRDENGLENVILLSMWRDRVSYPVARDMIKRLYKDYRDTGKEHNINFTGTRVDMCIIEAKASGDPLIQDLLTGGIRAIGFNPTPYGDKVKRVNLITHLIESGMVWVRTAPPHYEHLTASADIFVESVASFKPGESNDLVDSMTQGLQKLKNMNFLINRHDDRYDPYEEEPVKVY